MRFTFEGVLFRIVFRHERSRALGDHDGHATRVMEHKGFGHVVTCLKCRMAIGPDRMLPKKYRGRKTWCVIQVRADVDDKWTDLLSACGRTNESKGDKFNKADGRMAALENVLNAKLPEGVVLPIGASFPVGEKLCEDFKYAVRQTYANRKDDHVANNG